MTSIMLADAAFKRAERALRDAPGHSDDAARLRVMSPWDAAALGARLIPRAITTQAGQAVLAWVLTVMGWTVTPPPEPDQEDQNDDWGRDPDEGDR